MDNNIFKLFLTSIKGSQSVEISKELIDGMDAVERKQYYSILLRDLRDRENSNKASRQLSQVFSFLASIVLAIWILSKIY